MKFTSSHRRCPSKKVFLKISQYSQENTCVGVNFIKKTPTQVFSYEYCKIFKNSFFYRTSAVAASENYESSFWIKL